MAAPGTDRVERCSRKFFRGDSTGGRAAAPAAAAAELSHAPSEAQAWSGVAGG
jgi:hypothetical protein